MSIELVARPSRALAAVRHRAEALWCLSGASALWHRPPALVSPREAADSATMFGWAREYLSKPHPQLGRKGLVCPFVPKALAEERFLVTLRYAITTPDLGLVARTLLESVRLFERRFAQKASRDQFNSLLMVFPALPAEHGHIVDVVHTRHKSRLMKRGIMLSQFHPSSTKPAIYNPDFAAYTAPFPCIVIRHMGLHDIAFLAHNRAAFAEYRRRFGERYAAAKVSNEHGYADMFQAACARFSL